MTHIRRSPLKGVRRTFVTGLPMIRVERTLDDALCHLGTVIKKKTDFEARNSHRRHLHEIGESSEFEVEPEFKEGLNGQFKLF